MVEQFDKLERNVHHRQLVILEKRFLVRKAIEAKKAEEASLSTDAEIRGLIAAKKFAEAAQVKKARDAEKEASRKKREDAVETEYKAALNALLKRQQQDLNVLEQNFEKKNEQIFAWREEEKECQFSKLSSAVRSTKQNFVNLSQKLFHVEGSRGEGVGSASPGRKVQPASPGRREANSKASESLRAKPGSQKGPLKVKDFASQFEAIAVEVVRECIDQNREKPPPNTGLDEVIKSLKDRPVSRR
jgi:hypothetical protein